MGILTRKAALQTLELAQGAAAVGAAEILPGKVKVKFLRASVANQRAYNRNDEALVSVEDAALLRSGDRVECLSALPAPKREPHPYRGMELARLQRKAQSIRRGLNCLSEWIMRPLTSICILEAIGIAIILRFALLTNCVSKLRIPFRPKKAATTGHHPSALPFNSRLA